MHKFKLALFTAVAMAAAATVTQPAGAIEYPWCAQYGGGEYGGGGTNCGFSTIEQCRATISGMGGFCQLNPFYPDYIASQRQPRKTKRNARPND